MKVTLLYSKYLSDPTGASAVMRFLHESKSLFEDKGVDIDYYTRENIFPNKIKGSKAAEIHGIKKYLYNLIDSHCRTNSLAALLHLYIRSGRAAKTLVSRYRQLNRKADVVFMHELNTCYYYLKTRKKEDTAKVVLVVHTNGELYKMDFIQYPCLRKGFLSKYYTSKGEFVLKHIDKIGFVAESSSLHFIEIHPRFDKNNVFFNYNGVPEYKVNDTTKNPEVLSICCVGTICERKGQRFIIEALKELPENLLGKIHINIIGNGTIKDELYNTCKDNNILDFISFLGSRTDIAEILAENDIFILPSLGEGLPISILEAMRQGLPIISTRVGGIPEMIIEGETGFLIEPSKEGVKDFLMNLDKYDWKKMGDNSKRLFDERFSLHSMVNGYSEVFHNLLKK